MAFNSNNYQQNHGGYPQNTGYGNNSQMMGGMPMQHQMMASQAGRSHTTMIPEDSESSDSDDSMDVDKQVTLIEDETPQNRNAFVRKVPFPADSGN